jgi:hypothetical protein
MSDNYIKFSQIGLTEPVIPENGVVDWPVLNTECELSNLAQATKAVIPSNNLPLETISVSMLSKVNVFKCTLNIVSSAFNRYLYTNTNRYLPNFIKINSDPYDLTLTVNSNFNRSVNNILITALTMNEDGKKIQEKDLITELTIERQDITSLELNLPSLESLTITNCPYLNHLSLGKCKNLRYLNLSGCYCAGAIKLDTLAPSVYINVANNLFRYIEIVGSDETFLTSGNCVLIPQSLSSLSGVKFKNCSLTSELVSNLQKADITVEIV